MKAKQRIVCIANCIISPELTEKLANSFDSYNLENEKKIRSFNVKKSSTKAYSRF